MQEMSKNVSVNEGIVFSRKMCNKMTIFCDIFQKNRKMILIIHISAGSGSCSLITLTRKFIIFLCVCKIFFFSSRDESLNNFYGFFSVFTMLMMIKMFPSIHFFFSYVCVLSYTVNDFANGSEKKDNPRFI